VKTESFFHNQPCSIPVAQRFGARPHGNPFCMCAVFEPNTKLCRNDTFQRSTI
jgi:hypothetical protein